MAANRTRTGKTQPKYPKPNRLRFTKKPEKLETGETETAVLNRFPKISNGHNWGAILSNQDETLSRDIAMMRSIFWEGCHRAWDVLAISIFRFPRFVLRSPGFFLVCCGCSRIFHGLFTGCLLYTSPSPRDKRQSRMPSSA